MSVDMSEWLRRQTRNLLGFACAGSNPAVDDIFLFYFFAMIGPNLVDIWANLVGPKSHGGTDCKPSTKSLGIVKNSFFISRRKVDMSEWLRRQTRNLLGFACAGSNPAVDDIILFIFLP